MSNLGQKTASAAQAALPFLILLLLLLPLDLFARAGGGGGGGGGRGGIGAILIYPFVLVYIGILHYKLHRKNQEAADLIARISAADSGWNMENLKSRVAECYFKVQEAWTGRDQEIARGYMSRRLYEKHKAETDLMIAKGERNVLKDIDLLEARIVEAVDYTDNSRDQFWVYIKGAMIDYKAREPGGEVISGKPHEQEKFTELWKFTRENGRWVLDEIDSEVSLEDLCSFRSGSEQV
ncbi:MAG: Tim44-like domain-containing protein [Elusimicrobiales bacterium]